MGFEGINIFQSTNSSLTNSILPSPPGIFVPRRVKQSLRTSYPTLASEFHPTKNGDLVPELIAPASHKKVWWLCKIIADNPCGNEWFATVANRTKRGSGCPYCSGRTVHSDGRNSMRNTHPELVSEFHPIKNGELTPDNVKAGTNRKLHWICDICSHEWFVSGNKRAGGTGCPACANKAIHIDGRNSMRKTHPIIAAELHTLKNGELNADNLVASTQKKLWWLCSACEHEWENTGEKRSVRNQSCPACAGQSLHIDGRNSLAQMFPDVAKQWHPKKNRGLSPDEVYSGSKKSVWWLCPKCENEWSAMVSQRGPKGRGCSYCSKNMLHSDGRNSLRKTNPELSNEFHPTKNGVFTPEILTNSSEKTIIWICNTCNHEWKNTVRHRAKRGQGCPSCAGKKVHLDGRNSMRNTHPNLASDFHPSRNKDLTPDIVLGGSHTKFWWLCSTCEHEWAADRHSGNKCPACARLAVHSDGRNSMRSTHPKLAEEFHPTKNGDLTPENLLAGTSIKIWWSCSECSYVWYTAGANRLDKTNQKGSGCPACAPTGFDGSKPGYLYSLHYQTGIDEWYKFGITNNEVRYRVNQLLLSARKSKLYRDAEIHIIEELYFKVGREAEELERRIKREMKGDGLKFYAAENIAGKQEFVITEPMKYGRAKGWIKTS